MDYAWSSAETLILLNNHPVVSVVWLCLIMLVYYAARMEPFRGKLLTCWGMCKDRISFLYGNSSFSSFERLLQMLSVGDAGAQAVRYTSRPTK